MVMTIQNALHQQRTLKPAHQTLTYLIKNLLSIVLPFSLPGLRQLTMWGAMNRTSLLFIFWTYGSNRSVLEKRAERISGSAVLDDASAHHFIDVDAGELDGLA